eukprot:694704-Rhodomonas_salina.2
MAEEQVETGEDEIDRSSSIRRNQDPGPWTRSSKLDNPNPEIDASSSCHGRSLILKPSIALMDDVDHLA